jgi:hypothetical protein
MTAIQLFFRDPPAQRHSPTSVAAAEAIKPAASGDRVRIALWLRLCGEEGATDEEIQHGLQMNPSTQRPRRVELVRAGLVADSGRTRKTNSGCKAVVWVTTSNNYDQVNKA